MLLNLTDVLSNEGRTEDFTVTYTPAFFKKRGGQYKVLENGPVSISLQNTGKGKLHLTGKGKLLLQVRCDRCLGRVDVPIEVSFDEEISEETILHLASETDEYPYLSGYELDTDVLIGNEILINWPVKILCKEDCKGICPKCGRDLNQGDCGCDTFEPDPRMAVLKDIFIANKEV